MSRWIPSLNALRALEAVGRHLSFRQAAAELHVTPAAVQQLVRGLEDALGQKLVVRRGRGVALTEAGHSGQPGLREAFERIADAVERMRRQETRQVIKLTVEPSFAASWLVRRLDGFRKAFPDIDVLIDASIRVVDLDRDDVDIAIRYWKKPTGFGFVRVLFEDRTVAVCNPALASGLACPNDLAGLPLVHFDWPHGARRTPDWQTWLKAVGVRGVDASAGLRFTDDLLALQAAIAGQGVALASYPLAADSLQAGLLICPFKESVRNGFGYHLIAAEKRIDRPETQGFLDWIQAEAATADL